MEMRAEMKEAFAQRRQRTLAGEVRDALERMILQGDVGTGERLNENSLALQLGVSRGPVREAARSLEHDGLVTAVVNQGMFVRDLTVEDALELYDLRAMIAGYLCAIVAERRCPEVARELQGMVGAMHASLDDAERYFDLNLAFHSRIADAAGAGRARALYTSLGKEVRLMRRRVLTGRASLVVSNVEHARIVEAIVAGDVEAARAEGARHHLNGKQRLLETARD